MVRLWLGQLPRSFKSATDEMYNFQLISIIQFCLCPAVARHDLAIEFNRDPIRLHAKLSDERG